ncbi:YoaK family protein [Pandoraea sputorum]|uniref:Predicted membrane protein n=1 Tax=Pandoraea sputorum TaxID=93222 RepID=A0A239SCL6_9BURK|nr:YoaK family protein [Pandoraea sputorum]AJC16362.1 permease [Pandoraea sputorum]SNU82952.1 Predicted membrane protein [Pandoraea sputorum]VVE13641.1 permease [Pandoraea sputorum]VVE83130.1 permease [Pandoraea sputorum]BET11040.1 YoaK family protein [Pandoraea sputorum]
MGTPRHIPTPTEAATLARSWVSHFSKPTVIAMTLAFVAGYIDVVGFIALFGLFTAHVTGNFVMIGVQLVANTHVGVLAKLLALPVFVIFVAMVKLIVQGFANTNRRPLRLLLILQTLLLLGFMIIGMIAQPIISADAPLAILSGMFGVAALAIQNAIGRLVLADLAPTTIMTGNTTQIVIDMVELASGNCGDDKAARTRLRKMLPALAAFAVGAILGGFAYHGAGFWCVLLPVVLLAALATANE